MGTNEKMVLSSPKGHPPKTFGEKMGNIRKNKRKTQTVYDYEEAAKLRNYVFLKRYRDQVSNSAMYLYLALQMLEERGLGLCQPITATYRDMADVSLLSIGSVKSALSHLKGLLCEVEIGDPIKGNGKATQIRRYKMCELMNGELKSRLFDCSPDAAKRLAELMNKRSFNYGGHQIKPYWNVSQTGRVQSSRPNIQADKPEVRANNLCSALGPGEVLIYADFKSAEPSIIQQTIRFRFSGCPYELLAEHEGVGRKEAKGKVNMLAYCRSARKVVPHWPECVHGVFMPYAEALDSYKERLWKIGKPDKGKQRRFVYTLGGTKITAQKGKTTDRGKIMNWHIQGTVADILNSACLKITEQEEFKGWKFLVPLHDAVYVIAQPEQAQEIKDLMQDEAKRLNLNIDVDIKIFK